ncbi:echinoidin-like [Panulirus ornatus]|uniref:echinoidin-like n=1 Tax=Panulirus ornatus TaxID=150431 RepID=UPI003A88E738
MVATFYILLSLVVAATAVNDSEPAINEMRSAIFMINIALSQQAQILKELGNTTHAIMQERHCPPPYSRILDECFYVSPHSLSWDNARQHCQGLDGDLATPERVFALFSFLLDSGVPVTTRVWVGATDIQLEGKWEWLSGSPIHTSDWASGQPNNYDGAQDCLDFLMNEHPPLNDDSCSSKYRFACQHKDLYLITTVS